MEITAHYSNDRVNRERIINAIGEGHHIASVNIDRGDPRGPELHVLTDTGIILIYNANSHILITKLIARPSQMKKFFAGGRVPNRLWNLGNAHVANEYNFA